MVLSGSTVGAADASWEKDINGQGTGVTGQEWGVSGNSGSSWTMRGISIDFQPFVMRVDVGGTPEPGTLYGALGGLALIALGRWRRRK